MRDYGKVHTSFWTSETIRSLSEDGRTLAFYLISCPHGNIAGAFRLPDGYVCDDIQWTSERVSKGFQELFDKGFSKRCETTKWVWICLHFKWNKLENPNQRTAAAKIAGQVPESCAWKPEFMRLCGHFFGVEHKPESNPSETLPKPFPNQEQEQEQEQEQKLSGKPARKKPAARRPESWAPNEAHGALATELGVSLKAEIQKFTDYHDSKGSTFADWDAALRTWLRNAKQFSRSSGRPDVDSANKQAVDEFLSGQGNVVEGDFKHA